MESAETVAVVGPVGQRFSDLFVTDKKKEVSGVELEIGKDMYVTVARMRTPAYGRAVSAASQAKRFILSRKDAAAEEAATKIIVDAMAKHILLGWRGILDNADKEIPYSEAKARELLMAQDFREGITALADDMENFKAKADDSDVKNSQTT